MPPVAAPAGLAARPPSTVTAAAVMPQAAVSSLRRGDCAIWSSQDSAGRRGLPVGRAGAPCRGWAWEPTRTVREEYRRAEPESYGLSNTFASPDGVPLLLLDSQAGQHELADQRHVRLPAGRPHHGADQRADRLHLAAADLGDHRRLRRDGLVHGGAQGVDVVDGAQPAL